MLDISLLLSLLFRENSRNIGKPFATIKVVARLAGVSPSTVSRVLNQKGVISDETKQKIASAMEQLKYVPNDIARSFANGSAHAISVRKEGDLFCIRIPAGA